MMIVLRGGRADGRERIAAEHVRTPAIVDLGRGEDHGPCVGHCLDQRVVTLGRRLLGELEVERDHLRVARGDVVEHTRVIAAGKRPGGLEARVLTA